MKGDKIGCPVVLPNTIQNSGSSTYHHVLQEAKESALNYPQQSTMPTLAGPHSDSDFDSDMDTQPSDSDRDDIVQVDVDDDDDGDTDEEQIEDNSLEDNSEDEVEEDDEYPTIVWTGYGRRVPVLVFKADAIVSKRSEYKTIGGKYHLQFKFMKTDCKIVRQLCTAHGFNEAHPNSNDFNLMWTGSHLKPYVLRSLQEFQKVNHFPRSYEITRKDRLFKNIQRMQQTKGFKHFDFVPMSFIVPGEFQDFCSSFLKDKGPWIVKPIASSRGRGIFLVNHPEQVPLDDTLIVSKYIGNPLLIDGFKFDVRLYVAVTSYDPLIVYLYEEGLTRFATVKYEKNVRNIRNTMMHLTNYSVNKKSQDYVKNDDPDIEDYGNKWSLGALLRYLRSQGKDTTAMMMRVEDVVIKTLLSAELPIATACKMFMPFRGNCFEVYGFDILLDENLRPWVLEVNLSPSLACDAPIDLKIKSNMLADLFSLVGFVCHDPMMRKVHQGKRSGDGINGRVSRQGQGTLIAECRHCNERIPIRCIYRRSLSRPSSSTSVRRELRWRPKNRPGSAGSLKGSKTSSTTGSTMNRGTGLTSDEIKISRRAKEEYQRRGGWIRIFPSPDSWELYSSFMQYSTTNNLMLWQQLFPERAKNTLSLKPSTAAYSSTLARAKSVHLHSAQYPQLYISTQLKAGEPLAKDDALAQALQRSLQYERKLSALGDRRRRKTQTANKGPIKKGAPNISGNFKGTLVQGVPEDTMSTAKPVKSEDTKSNETANSIKPTKEIPENGKKQEVTGKPPLKRMDSKQSQLSSSSYSSKADVKGDSKKEEAQVAKTLKTNQETSKAKQQDKPNKPQQESSKEFAKSKIKEINKQDSQQQKTKSASSNESSTKQSNSNKHKEEKVASRESSPTPQIKQQNMAKYPYNVVELLEKGKAMTKVQARHAFATYLTRVQQRLLAESIHSEVEDLDQANEQMDLVLRFLKRAAGNLQQPFKVVVPSRKLPLNDRRRILAKQLGDFVHIYNKETEQLRHRNIIDKKCLRRGSKENNTLDEDKFNKFVHTASESELEEVLTTYTKLNKSASIFLGSNSKSSGDKVAPSSSQNQSEGSLPRRREQNSSDVEQPRTIEESRNGYYSGSTTDLNSYSAGMGSNSSLHRTPSQSSYNSAVAIYSTRLNSASNPSLRQRPSSASSQWSSASSKASLRVRPSSASMSAKGPENTNGPPPIGIREGPDGAACDNVTEPSQSDTEVLDLQKMETVPQQYNEEAINSALQRIAMRQQQRQYIASKGSNVLACSSNDTTPRYNNDIQEVKDISNGNVNYKPPIKSANKSGRQIQTNVDYYPIHDNDMTHNEVVRSSSAWRPSSKESTRSAKSVRSANDTFNSFVNDCDRSPDVMSAYNQVTGVNPVSKSYTPTFHSTQYQIAQHQMMLKQQRMIEQSKVLLEQSKAKHQAMIAQAHAAQKNQGGGEDIEGYLTPKPPTGSQDKKIVGPHRMARTQMLDEGLNNHGQFYNSLKYDSYTGTTAKPKVVYSSAYNTGM